jgi:hypothetical protein
MIKPPFLLPATFRNENFYYEFNSLFFKKFPAFLKMTSLSTALLLPPPPAPAPAMFVDAGRLRQSFFTSRVDYTPFIENSIPTGAVSIKRPDNEPRKRRRAFITPSSGSFGAQHPASLPSKKRRVEDDHKDHSHASDDADMTTNKVNSRTIVSDFTERPRGKLIATVPRLLSATNNAPFPDTWAYACHWDHHPFDTKPVGCPIRHDSHRNVYLIPIFCSWNCARAYGEVFAPAAIRGFIGTWICTIVRKLKRHNNETYDIREVTVPAAPHFSVLDSHTSGGMTIAQFRAVHCCDTRIVTIPEWLHIVPSGVNIYAIPPRNAQQEIATADPPAAAAVVPAVPVTPLPPSAPAAATDDAEAKKLMAEMRQASGQGKANSNALFRRTTTQNSKAWKVQRDKPQREHVLKRFMGIKTDKKQQ